MRGPDREIVAKERRLRRQQTDAERVIWFAVRDRRLGGFKFVRQEGIGPYVVDFVCREKMLIVEIDGGQHVENPRDAKREAFLQAEGYRVLRLWNNDVLSNREGVVSVILDAAQSRCPSPGAPSLPSPASGGGRGSPPSPRQAGRGEECG
ncbi:MAG: DUF559 domain-containing protein [Rhizobiales bacterium]|nr:DUF559 domain-containing protein [Hyphomicrobiales bacterium]